MDCFTSTSYQIWGQSEITHYVAVPNAEVNKKNKKNKIMNLIF
jgi:hypothetical protein